MKKIKFVFKFSYKNDDGPTKVTQFFFLPTIYWWSLQQKPRTYKDSVYISIAFLWFNIGIEYNYNK